jgi:hypothetical protein
LARPRQWIMLGRQAEPPGLGSADDSAVSPSTTMAVEIYLKIEQDRSKTERLSEVSQPLPSDGRAVQIVVLGVPRRRRIQKPSPRRRGEDP